MFWFSRKVIPGEFKNTGGIALFDLYKFKLLSLSRKNTQEK